MSLFGMNQSIANSNPVVTKPSGFFSTFGTGITGTIPSSNPGFINAATTAAPAMGSFGNAMSAAPPLGGFNNFGITSTPTIFASGNTTVPSFGVFGTSTTNTGSFGAFGSTVAGPTFGAGFSQQTPGVFGSFGPNFGKTSSVSTVTPGFGGFGGQTGFMMGQPQQQMTQISPDEAFAHSIFNVAIYSDERDTIIAKWNYLQAIWGIGKSFFSQNIPPVDISHQNYLCRFKAMGYSRLPGKDNKMGLVAMNFNKSMSDIRAQQTQILNSLNALFGNRSNLIINVECTKEYAEKNSQLVIYVEERLSTAPNGTKRVLATELASYLNQPNVKGQINTLGVTDVLALVLPDEDQLKEYLENAPKGIDPRMWRQAKLDNPDCTKFIPVPMIGFNDLKWRIKCQENETDAHKLYLNVVEKDISMIKQRHAAATARIMEYKRKLSELSHTILKIIVKQECTRKIGLALTVEEESLRTKLENMQALVSAPTQFKGRLSELLSQMRIQRKQYNFTGSEYTIDKNSEDEIKTFLGLQQQAIEAITDTVSKDLKALQMIIGGMHELMRS